MHPPRSTHPIRRLAFTLVVACLCSQSAGAQNTGSQNTESQSDRGQSDLAFEPYWVYVAQEEAFARCGPSGEYYRSDPLRHGQALEVYAETDDGWLGIRPPEDSFCWIPAETVEMDQSDEEGTVIEDRTVAWIGTHLGRARTYRWQVQLAKGEPVTVVGRSEREGPDGPQLWYRIVPPSGEYRWVHRDQVVNSSEELVAMMRRSSRSEEDEVSRRSRPATVTEPARTAQTRARESTAEPTADADHRSQESRLADASGDSILEPRRADSQANESWRPSDARRSVASAASVESAASETSETSETSASDDVATARVPHRIVTNAKKLGGLLASVEFLTRPRLLDIGASPAAPSGQETASDANWVAGAPRAERATGPNVASNLPVTRPANVSMPSSTPGGSIMQVSAQQEIAPQGLTTTDSATATRVVVSAERIAQIEAETRGADLQRLSLIFSRLMAGQATAAETEPIARAARSLASSSIDVVIAGRARELAERAERYRRVASRRDGETVIQNSVAPAAHTTQLPIGRSPLTSAVPADAAVETATQTGYLVQVYSARSHSPPFALTDNTGRTIAYVTPSPGLNLRTHLNSRVKVAGNSGFLTGLNTPHILATDAVRTPQ